ncbi:MAG: SIS domain-containing protein [Chlamydiales bacterium]|nr:SIS domain-containing protein [Chlamydiales bacterium]NCF70771.1 SIS domain-containing protein [Chlamydiales bacterium]
MSSSVKEQVCSVQSAILKESVSKAVLAAQYLEKPSSQEFILEAAKKIASAFRRGNKIIIAGNGGSLCDAAHFAEELTGQFREYRAALPAISLSEPGHLTCVSNDMGFDKVFSRGVEAFAQKGDIFIGLTTSGNSENIFQALCEAQKRQVETITFLGKSGGKAKGMAQLEWLVEGFDTTDRIQEAHMAAIHIIIELVEQQLFYAK